MGTAKRNAARLAAKAKRKKLRRERRNFEFLCVEFFQEHVDDAIYELLEEDEDFRASSELVKSKLGRRTEMSTEMAQSDPEITRAVKTMINSVESRFGDDEIILEGLKRPFCELIGLEYKPLETLTTGKSVVLNRDGEALHGH